MGIPWKTHDNTIDPWKVHAPWKEYPWETNGRPMGYIWEFRGSLIENLWEYGSPMKDQSEHHGSTTDPWNPHGVLWETHGRTTNPWKPRGSPMGQHCKSLVDMGDQWKNHSHRSLMEVPWETRGGSMDQHYKPHESIKRVPREHNKPMEDP